MIGYGMQHLRAQVGKVRVRLFVLQKGTVLLQITWHLLTACRLAASNKAMSSSCWARICSRWNSSFASRRFLSLFFSAIIQSYSACFLTAAASASALTRSLLEVWTCGNSQCVGCVLSPRTLCPRWRGLSTYLWQ